MSAATDRAIEALRDLLANVPPVRGYAVHYATARAALAAVDAQPAEPVQEPVSKWIEAVGLLSCLCPLEIDISDPVGMAQKIVAHVQATTRRQPLTDEQIAALVLQTVYEGDASTPHRDAWATEIGIPFARAIERHHGIGGDA